MIFKLKAVSEDVTEDADFLAKYGVTCYQEEVDFPEEFGGDFPGNFLPTVSSHTTGTIISKRGPKFRYLLPHNCEIELSSLEEFCKFSSGCSCPVFLEGRTITLYNDYME